MVPKIEQLEKGNAERTLLHADVGNEVINRVNRRFEISRGPNDRVLEDDSKVVFQLKKQSGGGGGPHPWQAALSVNDADEDVVTIQKGDIYTGLGNRVPKNLDITFPFTTGEVVDGSKVFMLVDYDADPGDIADAVFSIEVLNVAWGHASIVSQTWETDIESVEYEKQLIGRIAIGQVDDVDGTLVWKQIAKNDWWLATTVFSGRLANWPGTL